MAAPRYISSFAAPTEYERQAAEARRRQALAEALEAQAYQPLSGSAAPTPSAAPLVMALQSFFSARQRRKAEEAGEQATQMEQEFGRRIAGRLEGGYVPPSKEEAARVFDKGQRTPEQVMAATPAETTLQEVTPTAQYRKAPQEALSMAMTPLGMGAMKRAPLLAAALEKSMETPTAEEFGTTIVRTKDGKGVIVGKRGTIKEVDVTLPEEKPEAVTPVTIIKNGRRVVVDARTGTEIGQAPSETSTEPLIQIVGQDGKPVLVPRSQAVGKTPFIASGAGATEAERKDAYNLARIVNSVDQIQTAVKTEPSAVRPGFVEAAVGNLPFGIGEDVKYRAQSPQRQVIEGAQTELIDAALTLATGAAYTKEQLAGQVRALIPRYGESDESVKAKNARLKAIINSAKVRAGRAWTPDLDQKLAALFPALQEEEITDLPPR